MIGLLAQAQPNSYLGFQESMNMGPLYGVLGGVAAAVAIVMALQGLSKVRARRQRSSGKAAGTGERRRERGSKASQVREFAVPVINVDALISPASGRARPIPEEMKAGTVLASQRLAVKCLLLEDLTDVGRQKLKEVCARKLKPTQGLYIPMGSQLFSDEILHQTRDFVARLRKGALFLSPGGHPNAFLLDDLRLPLRRELGSNPEVLVVTDATAQRYLQALVDIPSSFTLLKEDILLDASKENTGTVEKGTLVISRGGALVGLMLEDFRLPHKGPIADLDALFHLRTNYERYPIESLIQRAAKMAGRTIDIARGTFIFSSAGRVYFVWKEGLSTDEATLQKWATSERINDECLLEVSKTQRNLIGGPGIKISQDELNYLRDVFRQAGTTNIKRETLLLDKNILYKFMQEFPYAQTGKFRGHLGKGVVVLNTASKGTFSIELGGNEVEMTELDLQAVRKYLMPEGRMLIKIGTLMRIRDEKFGDWIYVAHTNLFYPYDTFTRPYMEEFIPDSIRYKQRGPKMSSIIGFQEKPGEGDKAASGEPVGDLLALINNELENERIVFVLDGTLFRWRGRLYRVNEELVWRYYDVSDKLTDRDLTSLAHEWKIHPVVEEAQDEEAPAPVVDDEEEDLENLPFDTTTLR